MAPSFFLFRFLPPPLAGEWFCNHFKSLLGSRLFRYFVNRFNRRFSNGRPFTALFQSVIKHHEMKCPHYGIFIKFFIFSNLLNSCPLVLKHFSTNVYKSLAR